MTLLLNFLSCTKSCQEKTDFFAIKEVWIYYYFDVKGYTTASASGQLKRLSESAVSKLKMEQSDVDSLSYFISKSQIKKIMPRKTGQNILFAEIITEDDKKLKIIICHSLITDFTNEKDYFIKDKEYQKWLIKFKERIIKD